VLTGMKLGVNQLISMYGRERTQRMYASSLASIDCVEQIVHEESIACDFARCGHLEVACKQSHFDDYARQVEVIGREFHHELKIVPRSELRMEIGSDIYFGGMVDVTSVGLNPARYVAGLGSAAMRAGACIYESTWVESLERATRDGNAGWALRTSKGPMWSRDVFIATSGLIDTIPVGEVRRFEKEFLQFVETGQPGILKSISEKKALDDAIKTEIKKAVESFKERFAPAETKPV